MITTRTTLYLFAMILICQLAVAETQPSQHSRKQEIVMKLKNTGGLVAFWDFKEKEGHDRKARGMGKFPLKEMNGTLPRISEGPLSGYSAQFGNKAYLCLPISVKKIYFSKMILIQKIILILQT